jgi:prevent-host-death family protein
VRKTSLADAKAHLSELVDQAEHHGKRIVILRHGKPAAAIVPVEVAAPKRVRAKTLSDEEVRRSVEAFVREVSAAEPNVSAVEDLLTSRR